MSVCVREREREGQRDQSTFYSASGGFLAGSEGEATSSWLK